MRLFIAEKPSLGRAIADGLGGGSKRNGYIDCGKDVVTWCFGHLLEMLPPDGYDPEYKNWKKEHLPIIPAKWLYAPRKDAEEQLGVIGRLLSKSMQATRTGKASSWLMRSWSIMAIPDRRSGSGWPPSMMLQSRRLWPP